MNTILRIYTDGGLAQDNPSVLGGAYCVIAVKETIDENGLVIGSQQISIQSDILLPDELDASKKEPAKGSVSNNNTELLGVIVALETVPKLVEWVAGELMETLTIVTDSELAMKWAQGLYGTDSVPNVLLERLKDAYVHIGSLGFDTQFFPKYELIAGHPNQQELKKQFKMKKTRKYRVSEVNVRCDEVCGKICDAVSAVYVSGQDVTRETVKQYMDEQDTKEAEVENQRRPPMPEITGYGLKAGNTYLWLNDSWAEVFSGVPPTASEFQAFVGLMQRSELGEIGLRASYALGLSGESAEVLEALIKNNWDGSPDEIGDVLHYVFGSALLVGIDGDYLMASVVARIMAIQKGEIPPMPHTLADMAYTLPYLSAKYGELIKKKDYHSKEIEQDKLVGALHNVLFNLCGICNASNMTIQAAMTRNMAKLRERHPSGSFTPTYHDAAV